MYKAVAQLVLFFGSKIWVVTGEMLKVLEGFLHLAVRRIKRMSEKVGAGRDWEYPLAVESTKSAGLHTFGVYTRRRKETIAERVSCLPIYELYKEVERMPGTSRLVRWWDQDAVNEPEE